MQLRLEKYRRRATKQSELRYQRFLNSVYIDYDLFRVSVTKRFSDVEHLARKLQRNAVGTAKMHTFRNLHREGSLRTGRSNRATLHYFCRPAIKLGTPTHGQRSTWVLHIIS